MLKVTYVNSKLKNGHYFIESAIPNQTPDILKRTNDVNNKGADSRKKHVGSINYTLIKLNE